jgi:hypothetical protein
MRAFILRRTELLAQGLGDATLVGSSHSADTLRIKEFLTRNLSARLNFTQFASVCSTTPRLRDASAMLWPDSTSRTASSLNSSV